MAKNIEEPIVPETEPVEETPVSEMPVEEAPKRHPLYDKLGGEFPDDASVMDAAHAKLTEHEQRIAEDDKLFEAIAQAVDLDPEFAAITKLVAGGMPFLQAVARYVSPEELEAQEGDPDYEEMAKAKEERLASKTKADEIIATVEANTQESIAVLEKFAEDMEMDEEKKASFIESADQIFSDLSMGKISYDFLSKIYVAENHQKEVDAAVENAIIEGKNMAIDEKKEAAKVSKVGDGMPSLASAVPETKPIVQKQKSTSQKFLEDTGLIK